jgi:superfamily II DNA or RNA helicase
VDIRPLRQWQQRAIDEYLASAKQDFLLEATPGAGKTVTATTIARRLLDDRTIERVVVVVPSDSLREQWCDATAGMLDLRPLDDEIVSKPGYHGVVVSYQQLAHRTAADLLRRDAGRHKTFAIADEPHHAGDGRAYADGLTQALEPCIRRLLITGTPWRRDNRRIPYVTYGPDDLVTVDYHYRYAAAVNDRICRPVIFHAHNGEARWVDCGKMVEAHVCDDMDEEQTGAALDTLYQPDYSWIPAILRKAAAALDDVRAEVGDLGGIVWAESRWHARAYAALLLQITGEEPEVILGDDAEAKTKIDRFRRSRQRWLVCVKMVSEGVDIPRLAVGVFAAKSLTPLFFRQSVGRLVRVRPDEDLLNAQLFIPAVPQLVRHAYEIEQELLHELRDERDRFEREQKEAEERQLTLNFRVPVSASEPVYKESIHRGKGHDPAALEEARAVADKYGFSSDKVVNLASLLHDLRGKPIEASGQATIQPVPESRKRMEQRLRVEVEKLARRRDYELGLNPGTTNTDLLRWGFPQRKKCTIEQLEEIIKRFAGWS